MMLPLAIGERIRGLTGGTGLLLAFAGGALSATGFAPLNCFPFLLAGYALLVLLLDGAAGAPKPVRRAALLGWAFYFGQFLIGWHWLIYPFLIYPDVNLWQLPFASLLPAGVALFGALACGVAVLFWRPGPGRILVFAVLMVLSEWLRGHLFTGFPWNLSAYGWGASLAILQAASLMGAYGLSFLTILLGASLAELFSARWRMPVAMLLLFAGLWVFGAQRLSTTPVGDVPGVSVRLVQPDIPQAEKYIRALVPRNWRRLMELSIQPPAPDRKAPTHIVWPEAATGFALARSEEALNQIAQLTARGQTLMTGSDRFVPGTRSVTAYNSLYLFRPGSASPSVYDKFHLVPFGEYLPFTGLLNALGLRQLTVGSGFAAGDHPHVLNAGIAPPVTPLICYEVIFPHEVVDSSGPRPGWLVNITDDSWFGPWAGPLQHLLTAQMRAIEEGLPIARAANTGISAMIDPLGRARAQLSLNKMGVVDSPLPQALAPPLYARFGDLIFLIFLAIAILTVSFLGRSRNSRN
jgi:apolipoprotein N-acyltransferase